MRENMALLIWLETAVSGIRFKPDRAEAQKELYAHIEDKALDLQRIFPDISPDEARDRALAGMGDAEEIKRVLARVHRPWLGYLWRLSQALVCGVLLLALFVGGFEVGDLLRSNRWSGEVRTYRQETARQNAAVMDTLFGAGTPDRLALLAPEAEARLGRGRVSVPRAAWVREEGEDVLYLQLQVTWDRPWEKDIGFYVSARLWAEDSQGAALERDGSLYAEEEGLNWYRCTMPLRGVAREEGYVRVHYLPGTDLDLTVDLSREVEG